MEGKRFYWCFYYQVQQRWRLHWQTRRIEKFWSQKALQETMWGRISCTFLHFHFMLVCDNFTCLTICVHIERDDIFHSLKGVMSLEFSCHRFRWFFERKRMEIWIRVCWWNFPCVESYCPADFEICTARSGFRYNLWFFWHSASHTCHMGWSY